MNDFNSIIKSDIPVLVDFYADWCAPCRMMPPILSEVKKEFGNKVRIIKINVDKNPSVAGKYGIRSIPTLYMFQRGEIKWKTTGVTQFNQIKEAIISKTVN